MRLIETSSLTLHEFFDDEIPKYGILSHTWGKEEVSFQAFTSLQARSLAGYVKIQRCCELAAKDDLDYVWVDTCCIDKSSSAELSEAINSMYRWYQNAERCYVYLFDMEDSRTWLKRRDGDEDFQPLSSCRWFGRGWTLQELLAPNSIDFYDQGWNFLGSKATDEDLLALATGIRPEHLWSPSSASVAQRMSWAAHRDTTRIEDKAYCLLGIFDVNMPLLYGEGKKAFVRLQEEILRSSHDETLFCWTNDRMWMSGILAESPADFAMSGDIVPIQDESQSRLPYFMTNHGLQINLNSINNGFGSGTHSRHFESPLLCTREGLENRDQITLFFHRRKSKVETKGNLNERYLVRVAPFELGSAEKEDITECESEGASLFFVQHSPIFKQSTQSKYRKEWLPFGRLPAASMDACIGGGTIVFDSPSSSQVLEMPTGEVGFYLVYLASHDDQFYLEREKVYLCWSKEDCNPKSVDVYCRDFDVTSDSWEPMDAWVSRIQERQGQRYELAKGRYPLMIWTQNSSVLFIAFRGAPLGQSIQNKIDIQVVEFMDSEEILRRISPIGPPLADFP